MRERVVGVMSAVFRLAPSDITDDLALGFTRNWDSLTQLNLVLALEDEFGVSFTDEETADMISLPLILEILAGKQLS